MVKVTLIYPFFKPTYDNSIFRFPPLGLGYIAASLKCKGVDVSLVDCTFLTWEEAISKVKLSNPQIIGVYSMFSMKKTSLEIAKALRKECDLLVVGGPLPTLDPASYLDVFDVVVLGEGEETMVEITKCYTKGATLADIKGIAVKSNGKNRYTATREFVEDLDSLPFPSRDLFDNNKYREHYLKRFGYSISPLITSRGCPFSCDFCSRPVFGKTLRSRSAVNIMDEVEEIVDLGYDRVWFADDCFTLNRKRLLMICDEFARRHLDVSWECLSRVDMMDHEVAAKMHSAGCIRVFFGIESGTNEILELMKKQITIEQARIAVNNAKAAGLQVGAFFIVGYPGESDKTVLETVRFASSLPLDYMSFTLPYPIPGTALFERVKKEESFLDDDWEEPKKLEFD